MKLKPVIAFGILSLSLAVIIICTLIASKNADLHTASLYINLQTNTSLFTEIIKSLSNSQALIILQVAIIIILARITGLLFKILGQPIVMGEIVAGLLLGPSVLGYYLPEMSHFLFPQSSLTNLQVLSNLGLLIFMFIVGVEFKLTGLKEEAKKIFVISYASVIVPFIGGLILAQTVLSNYIPINLSIFTFNLYIGVAISITSFTVLARIMRDREITNTRLGSVVISCTAINDLVAWCILAIIIASIKSGTGSLPSLTFIFVVVYVSIMFFIVKPILSNILLNIKEKNSVFLVVFSTILLSSYISEVIGIHILFGAFLSGIVMPNSAEFRCKIVEKLEQFSFVLLLPLYFAFTGLRTRIGLLNSYQVWFDCIIIILVSIIGKFFGTFLSARIMGESTKTSLSIGILMNTRGLTELVVLNIGYDLGILSPQLFTIMIVMALFTTLITSPILTIINRIKDNISIKQPADSSSLQQVISSP